MQTVQSKYLGKADLEAIFQVTKKRDRDYAIIFFSYRHGLRCSELLNLKWSYIDWEKRSIFIARVKGSDSGYHQLAKDEITLLKRLRKNSPGDFIISGRQGEKLSTSRVRQICYEITSEAALKTPFHHHQLRHTCALHLAANLNIHPLTIQRFLGHKDFKSTDIYLREAGRDFSNLGDWWN